MKPASDIARVGAGSAPAAYWEPRVNSLVAMLAPGGYAVTERADLTLATLLGSCVAACICDPKAEIGGLNHFFLPDDGGAAPLSPGDASRYGAQAMVMLIDEILKQGGARARLEAKLFGGANMISTSSASPVGERNRGFALDYLRREAIPVTAADLGGERARRVFFRPAANKVLVQALDGDAAGRVRREEARLRQRAAGVLR
jgi:chemotaxis protein CheD